MPGEGTTPIREQTRMQRTADDMGYTQGYERAKIRDVPLRRPQDEPINASGQGFSQNQGIREEKFDTKKPLAQELKHKGFELKERLKAEGELMKERIQDTAANVRQNIRGAVRQRPNQTLRLGALLLLSLLLIPTAFYLYNRRFAVPPAGHVNVAPKIPAGEAHAHHKIDKASVLKDVAGAAAKSAVNLKEGVNDFADIAKERLTDAGINAASAAHSTWEGIKDTAQMVKDKAVDMKDTVKDTAVGLGQRVLHPGEVKQAAPARPFWRRWLFPSTEHVTHEKTHVVHEKPAHYDTTLSRGANWSRFIPLALLGLLALSTVPLYFWYAKRGNMFAARGAAIQQNRPQVVPVVRPVGYTVVNQ